MTEMIPNVLGHFDVVNGAGIVYSGNSDLLCNPFSFTWNASLLDAVQFPNKDQVYICIFSHWDVGEDDDELELWDCLGSDEEVYFGYGMLRIKFVRPSNSWRGSSNCIPQQWQLHRIW
jgi:hypothetical protein